MERRALELVRLLDEDARGALLQGALLRARQRDLGPAPTPEAVRAQALAFRKARGLLKASELDRWLSSRALTPRGFAALMADEARVLVAQGEGGAVTPGDVLDYLRVALGTEGLWREAALEGPEARAPAAEAARWYFEQRLGVAVPEDLEEAAAQRDFDDSSDFLEAVRRLHARQGPPAAPGAPSGGAAGPGDPAPSFQLENHAVGSVRLELLAGRRAALVFTGSLSTKEGARWALQAGRRSEELAEDGRAVLVLTPDALDVQAAFVRSQDLAVPLLSDRGGEVAARYGAAPGTVVELDANLRVARRSHAGEPWGEAPLGPAGAAGDGPRAPVLLIPGALAPDTCGSLCAAWASDHREGAVTRLGARGAEATVASGLKRRLDHVLADPTLLGEVRRQLASRVLPEVERCFQRRVELSEALRVGAYRAEDRGHFAPHRDDANAAAGRRRFALAVNLNTGSYRGGRLRFPEYEDSLDAPRGSAVVYSVALLHAVGEVTDGARMALVGFLGDAP